MHLATIPAPVIAPAVGIVVGKKGSFLRLHAIKSLKETIVTSAIIGVGLICSLCYSAYRLWTLYQANWEGFDLKEFLIRSIIAWLILWVISLFNFVGALRAAKRAFNGEWPSRSGAPTT